MNFLNIIKNYFPASLVEDAAQKTGESTIGISSLINAAIPTILGGLISKSSSDGSAAFNIAQGASNSGLLGHLDTLLGGSSNAGGFDIWATIKSLFGDKVDGLVSMLSNFAGVKESSSKSILGLSSVATLGAVGSYAKEHNLDQIGFASFLNSQKSNLASWMPSGFDFSKATGLLGLGSLFAGSTTSAAPNVSTSASSTPPNSSYNNQPEQPKKGNGWIVPLIIIAAVAGLIWWLMKGCNKDDEAGRAGDKIEATVNDAATAVENTATAAAATVAGKLDSMGNWIADWGTEKVIKLADGTELKVGENSTEYKLYNFITNTNFKIDTVDKSKNWYSFDRVYFETGKSVLTGESQAQVKNIALILKNYPQASIKIGGYTDNTGNADINKKVSDERAKIVSKELVKLGAAANQVVEAVGYGPEFPIASNDTPEGKAQNRRVDLKVASK